MIGLITARDMEQIYQAFTTLVEAMEMSACEARTQELRKVYDLLHKIAQRWWVLHGDPLSNNAERELLERCIPLVDRAKLFLTYYHGREGEVVNCLRQLNQILSQKTI